MIKLEYCNNCVHEKCRTDQGRYESQLIPMFIETPCIYMGVPSPSPSKVDFSSMFRGSAHFKLCL